MNDPMMIRTKDHDIVKIVIKGSNERINVMSIDNLFSFPYGVVIS